MNTNLHYPVAIHDLSNLVRALHPSSGKFAVWVNTEGDIKISPESDTSYKKAKFFAGIFEFDKEYQPIDLAEDKEAVSALLKTMMDAWNSKK